MAQIGVQMMMLKSKVNSDGIYSVFEKCKNIGYETFEVSQIPLNDENKKEISRAIENLGITICALSVDLKAPDCVIPEGFLNLESDFDEIVENCKLFGVNYIRIGSINEEYKGSENGFTNYAKILNYYSEKLEKHNINLYYHNHHFEFQKYENNINGLDLLYENTNSKLGFEIDVHWVHRGGENPIKIINHLKDRVDLIHLKDYRIKNITTSIEEGEFMGLIEFAEVGNGNLNFKKIIDASLKSNVKYLLIEQDDLYGVDPYDSLRTSYSNLVSLGYEYLF